jgi:predicted nucleic acid-binding protein
MARFVVDASVTLTWCFEDEATEWSDALLSQPKSGGEAVVPAHWPAEAANSILMAVRRGRIGHDKASRFFRDLRALPIRVDPEGDQAAFGRVFGLAAQHALTVYDAGLP